MATRFRALAAPIDMSTGDERRFSPNITVAPMPIPLRWPREDMGAHDGAVTIGAIDEVDIDDDEIWVEGRMFDDVDPAVTPRLAEDVAHAMTLAREGVLGISVDLDDYEASVVRKGTDEPLTEDEILDPGMQAELLITKGRIRACTLVDIPAFAETNHTFELFENNEDDEAVSEPEDEPDPNPELAALVAAVSGDTGLPVGDRAQAWDGPGAAKRIFDAYSDKSGKIDKARASKAFLWVDGDGSERGYYKLGFADIVDGKLTIIPRGVAATAGGRGVDSTDGIDREAVKARICGLYAKIRKTYDDWPACPFDKATMASAEHAALTASVGAVFAFDDFTAPVVDRLTPITYDWERGIVYGHVAPWGLCHEGISNACVLAPKDASGNYREFHAHRVETDQGTVYAGRITSGGHHPEVHDGITAHHVRHHHDDMTTVAYVRATEDAYGIFVCGPIMPGLDAETREVLSRRKVSGDWRETVDGLSMIEVLALSPGPKAMSEPGFPVRTSFAGGRQIALVASLVPAPLVEEPGELPVYVLPVEGFALSEAFRQAYHVIKDEEVRKVEAGRLRMGLAESMRTDAARMRADLARTIGV